MTALPDALDSLRSSDSDTGTRVQLRSIDKSYGQNKVLHGVDLDIAPGEFVSLLGPSGCGKTTALRVLAGLEQADSGTVLFGGKDVTHVPTNKRDIGMVFQSYSLFPHLNLLDNAAFGLRRRGVNKTQAAAKAHDALALVGLDGFSERYPHQLSGGQQQRVALARALVTEPQMLLLDEPLSALDAKVRVQLRDEIRRIQLSLGITTVFVTHDQEEALAISDRIAVMNAGRIDQIGVPEELYLRPATPHVASFVGLSSVVDGVADGNTVTVWGTTVPTTTEQSGDVELLLRPENIRFVTAGGVEGVVQESTFLGSMRRTLVLTADGAVVRVQHDAHTHPQFGETVRLDIAPVPVSVRAKTDVTSSSEDDTP